MLFLSLALDICMQRTRCSKESRINIFYVTLLVMAKVMAKFIKRVGQLQ